MSHLIKKLQLKSWQIFFETKLIKDPFVYQAHFFLEKVNTRGKQQSRIMVCNNKVHTINKYKYSLFLMFLFDFFQKNPIL